MTAVTYAAQRRVSTTSGTSASGLFREPRSLSLAVLTRRRNLASLTLAYCAEFLKILALTDFVVAPG